MVDNRPNENIWYYLKREAYKEVGDARELTSPLSIFADELETCTNFTSSYLGGASQASNQYTSVYGDGNAPSQNIYAVNSSLYATNLTSVNSDIGGSSYIKDSFWKDDSAVSSYSIPSSAGYLAADNTSGGHSLSTPTDDLNSIVSYINTYSDYSTSGNDNQNQTNATTYSSYIEAFSEHGGNNAAGNTTDHLQNSTNSSSSSASTSYLHSPLTDSNNSTSGLETSAGSCYSPYQQQQQQGGSYLNQKPLPPPQLQQQDMTLSGDSVQSNTSSTNINLMIKEGIEESKSSLPWNESFQELLDRPVNSLEEERVRNHSISLFSQHLANTATTYVKTLVQEVHMRPEQKTIKPFEGVGGFAGGEKYRVESMFIKFALNPHQIYERSNPVSYFANKSAGHELKSINALVSCGVPNLHFPLMCLLNYRGFRLIVISELPISSKTLVFGSSNAGETIHKNETVLKMMVKVGEILNLKEHLVEENKFSIRRTGQQFTIPLAIDIEGHFGFDGRYYVVDTARLFPPETPIPGITGCHLYRLFRPEFVKKYETQLCSDAFANFNVVNQEPYNEQATKANNHLILEYIPSFVQRFIEMEVSGKTLKEVLHKEGINLRYLGVILYHLVYSNISIDEPRKRYLQGLLVIEMLARVMRFVVFTEMRQINSPDDEPHLTIAVTHLNKLLSIDLENKKDASTLNKYWNIFLTKSLIAKYSYTCTTVPKVEKQVEELFNSTKGLSTILQSISDSGVTFTPPFTAAYYSAPKKSIRYKLLKKFAHLTGLVFDENIMKQLKDQSQPQQPLQSQQPQKPKPLVLQVKDIKQINVTVKHMRVSSSFKTFVNYSEAETYYKTELEYKSNKLGKDHTQVALAHIHLAELYETYSNLQGAQRHYRDAISIYQNRFGVDDIGTANFKEKLALCLIKQKNYLEASKLLESVLTVKIKIFKDNSIEVADTYDNLAWTLQSQGSYEKSLSYYNKALKIKASKSGNSQSVAKTLNNLGHLLLSHNELEKSLNIFLKVEDIFVKQYGRNHSDVAVTLDNIGLVYTKKKNYSLAEKYFKDCLDIRIKQFGEVSRYVALTLDHMAQMYISWGRAKHSEAQKIFDRCIDISDRFPDHYLKAFLRYNYSKLYKKRKEKTKELDYLGQAQMIFEMNNITTDLLPKIRKRIETLNKSGLSRIKDWFNAPTMLKLNQQPDIQVSQHLSGHMEMLSSNVNSRNEDVPSEWQAILNEAGISKENWNDPTYMQMIQDYVSQEELERQRNNGNTNISPFVNPFVAVEEGRKKMQEMGKKLKNKANLYGSTSSSTSSNSSSLSSSDKDKKKEKKEEPLDRSGASGGGAGGKGYTWNSIFTKSTESKAKNEKKHSRSSSGSSTTSPPTISSTMSPPSPGSVSPASLRKHGNKISSKSESNDMSLLTELTAKRLSLENQPPPALPQPIFSPPLSSSVSSSSGITYRSSKNESDDEDEDDASQSADSASDDESMKSSSGSTKSVKTIATTLSQSLPPTTSTTTVNPAPAPISPPIHPIITTPLPPHSPVTSPTPATSQLYPRLDYTSHYPPSKAPAPPAPGPTTYAVPPATYYYANTQPIPTTPTPPVAVTIPQAYTYNATNYLHYYPPQQQPKYGSPYGQPYQQQPYYQQPRPQPYNAYQSPPPPPPKPIAYVYPTPPQQPNYYPSLSNNNNNNNNNSYYNYSGAGGLYPPGSSASPHHSNPPPVSITPGYGGSDLSISQQLQQQQLSSMLRETKPSREDPTMIEIDDSDDEDDDEVMSPPLNYQPQQNPYLYPSTGLQSQQNFNWPSVRTPLDKDRLISMLKSKFQQQQQFKI